MGDRDKPLYPGNGRFVARRKAEPSAEIPSERTGLRYLRHVDPRANCTGDARCDEGLGRHDGDSRQPADLATFFSGRHEDCHHVASKRR